MTQVSLPCQVKWTWALLGSNPTGITGRTEKPEEASQLFGNEKDKSFSGILQTIVQTFDNNYLYTTIEEQAANLLYLVIKNHPFVDGNKRIGAFLFIWFLEKISTVSKKMVK